MTGDEATVATTAQELTVVVPPADPLVGALTIVAVIVVAMGGLFRRGSLDARFVVEVFASIATIGSGIKMMSWVTERLAGREGVAPTGTDLLLIVGLLFVVLLVAVQGLAQSFTSTHTEPSPFGRLVGDSAWFQGLRPSARKLIGMGGTVVEEDRRGERLDLGDGDSREG